MSFLKNCCCVCASVPVLSATAAVAALFHAELAFASTDLQQTRNGARDAIVTPIVDWANGNANATQAHFAEGHSIGYRAYITGLTPGSHWIQFSYDTRKSGKNAIDFLTHFQRLEPHTAFPHAAEVVNPIDGLAGTWAAPTTFPIPAPQGGGPNNLPAAGFVGPSALPAGERLMTIYNGTITNISYPFQGSLALDTTNTIIRIEFTNTATNVVIAFGGHIARQFGSLGWGTGTGAGSLNGSPYHTTIESSSYGDNGQACSLMANAIVQPPLCNITGDESVCPGSTDNVFSGPEAPAGETFTYEWTITSACGATFEGGETTADTREVTVIACDDCGSFTLDLDVTSDGTVVSCSTDVQVEVDTPINIVSCPPNPAPLNCGASLPAPFATVAAFVAAGGEVSDTCGPLSISSQTGTVPQCGTVIRTYTITDACGNSDTCQQTFTFQDNVDPILSGCPTSVVNIQCASQIPALPTVTANDACAGNLGTITPVISDVGTGCPGSTRVITRTWTATDPCGNSASCTQTINILDNTQPVLSGCPTAVVNVQCVSQVPTPATVTANDNCAGSITPVFNQSDNGGSGCAASPLVITRTWTATDACGNSRSCSQTITVIDNVDPILTGCPNDDFEVDCVTDIKGLPTVTATDNCGGNLGTIQPVIDEDGTGCESDPLVITVTWTAVDACGNDASCSMTITVIDDIDPELECPPDQDVECGDIAADPAQTVEEFIAQGGTVFDNCSDVTITWLGDEQISEGAECPLIFERTYEAEDACGNTAQCTQIIQLIDTSPPVQCCVVPEVIGCVGFPVAVRTPVVTDECGLTITPVATRSDGLALTDPFPLGETTVTWNATDGCGNQAEEIVVTVIMNDCPVFRTKIESGWAGASNSLIQDLLSAPAGGDIVVGKTDAPARAVTLQSAAASCLALRLPTFGNPVAIPNGFGNQVLDSGSCNTATALPLTGDGKFTNTLLGSTLSLALNIRFDDESCDGNLADLQLCSVMTSIKSNGAVVTKVIPESVILALGSNPTVGGLLELANKSLAGRSTAPANRGSINSAVTRVNQLFNHSNCVALLSSSCASSAQATSAPHSAVDSGSPNASSTPIGSGESVDASSNGRDSGNREGVVSRGLIAPALTDGVTVVDNNFTQAAEGTLLIELRGPDAATRCDLLTVNGDALLGGTLVVDVTEDFMPIVGEEFEVVTADSVTGAFDHLMLADLAGDPYLDVRYTPTSVMVDVKTLPVTAGDLDRNGRVDVADLLALLRDWGTAKNGSDVNDDGSVNAADLIMMLSNWGTHTPSAQ